MLSPDPTPVAPPHTCEHGLALALKARHESLCGKGCVVGFTDDNTEARFVTLLCGAWHCSRCGRLKAANVRRRILAGKPTRFITLTHKPRPHETLSEALKSMALAWSRLAARLRKEHNLDAYVRILELTGKGWPHYHILYTGRYISQAHLSNLWDRYHRSPIVHIQKLKDGPAAARYIAKYLTKLTHLLPIICRRTRVVSYSRNWPSAQHDGAAEQLARFSNWIVSQSDANQVYQDFLLSDVHIDSVNSLSRTIAFSGPPEVLTSIRAGLIQRGTVAAHVAADAMAPKRSRSPPRSCQNHLALQPNTPNASP